MQMQYNMRCVDNGVVYSMDFHFPRTSLDNKEVLTYLEQAWNRTGNTGSALH